MSLRHKDRKAVDKILDALHLLNDAVMSLEEEDREYVITLIHVGVNQLLPSTNNSEKNEKNV